MKLETEATKTFILFSKPMTCISSAIFGGGIKTNVSTIANITIPKDLEVSVDLMPDYCRKTLSLARQQVKTSVVLLTAVPQTYLGYSKCQKCFVTAGLGNVSPLNPEKVWDEKSNSIVSYLPGTINCIIVLDDSLTPSALIEGYGIAKMTIAEVIKEWCAAKKLPPGVGTTTDCTALLCPKNGPKLRFAGLGTKVGSDISTMAREATVNAISHKYPNWFQNSK